MFAQFLDLFHNLPAHLQLWATDYGAGLYIILGLIIFCETGLIFMPLLPGDSLLFATGALLAMGLPGLDIFTMCLILSVCAVVGDMVNYHVGKWMAPRLFKTYEARWLNRKHLDRTHQFYEKHGGKTIIFARFVPIVRTYAPFVAGLSGMSYSNFFLYNFVGGVTWIVSFTCLGYFFGNLPGIKENFQYVIIAILVVSVLPVVFEFIRARRA